MKLIYRIALRLSLALIPLMAVWAVLFYFTVVDEFRDETDDSLETYSELIITRLLAGRELPTLNNGSNNSYSITPVDAEYAATHPHLEYYDADVYIPEKEENEPARILITIFRDAKGTFYELKIATPTIDTEDLLTAVLSWIGWFYLLLMLTTIGLTIWIIHRSMQPLYALLQWLDKFTPGRKHAPVPDRSSIPEFRRINRAAQQAADRAERLFEQQKQFIGNASHELQTPLAILGSRLEWLTDRSEGDPEQLAELLKMQRTLGRIVRLNKTLLLLTRIENGQFPESTEVDIAATVAEQAELCDEVFVSRGIRPNHRCDHPLLVRMNESLAGTLVANLLRNAYLHTPEGGAVDIRIVDRTLIVANDGSTPLDAERIFDRFYRGSGQEHSTGLGLALVSAICRYYDLRVDYRFEEGRHRFSVVWP